MKTLKKIIFPSHVSDLDQKKCTSLGAGCSSEESTQYLLVSGKLLLLLLLLLLVLLLFLLLLFTFCSTDRCQKVI